MSGVLRQIRTLGHTCTGNCICTMEENTFGEEKLVVNAECPVTGHSRGVTSVAIMADGKRVVSGSGDTHVKIWDADNGAEVHNPGQCTTGVPR